MKLLHTIFVTVLVSLSSFPSLPNNYYFHSMTGSDLNCGTNIQTPFKSTSNLGILHLTPGDTLFFACGSVFTGGFEIKNSGIPDKPIVLTRYEEGPAPAFTNPSLSLLNGNAIRISGNYITVDGLNFFDCAAANGNDSTYTDVWDVGAVRIMLDADHCTIRNCEFSNCPKGVQSTGKYALITHNYFHSANSRPLSFPGWGPIAIHMGNSYQEVSYNVITDYYYIGGEFGGDGGALELDDGRNPKTDIYIHHNYSSSNMGFLEVSWYADIARAETHNMRIAYNVSDDYQDFVMLWAPVHEVYIENNTIIRHKQIPTAIEPTVFLCEFGGVNIRNNIVVVDSLVTVFTRHAGDHQRKHNIFWALDGTLPRIGCPLDTSEIYNVNPLFVKQKKGPWDYSTEAESMAVDHGLTLPARKYTDFKGRNVPLGNSTDIGAFEYQMQ